MLEHDPNTMLDEFCLHALPLTSYCPNCFAEYNDEYLRQVNLVVDPTSYREPDVNIRQEGEELPEGVDAD